jgi:hypothetical protein
MNRCVFVVRRKAAAVEPVRACGSRVGSPVRKAGASSWRFRRLSFGRAASLVSPGRHIRTRESACLVFHEASSNLAPRGRIGAGSGAGELPADETPAPRQDARGGGGPIPDEIKPTEEQKDEILTLIRSLQKIGADLDWGKRCQEFVGADWNHTTRTMAGTLIEKLKAELGALTDGEPPGGVITVKL